MAFLLALRAWRDDLPGPAAAAKVLGRSRCTDDLKGQGAGAGLGEGITGFQIF
jgi:hypothetical protein